MCWSSSSSWRLCCRFCKYPVKPPPEIWLVLIEYSFVYIVPAIAQDLLNKGNITITSAQILQPHADNVMLTMTASIYIPGGFTVGTDPSTLEMFVPGSGPIAPFGHLYLPERTIHGNTTTGVTNQLTPILNQTSWQQFVTNTIMLQGGPLGLDGNVHIHLGKLNADLTLNKAVWSNGQYPYICCLVLLTSLTSSSSEPVQRVPHRLGHSRPARGARRHQPARQRDAAEPINPDSGNRTFFHTYMIP
jgi:hypothetical protein